MISLIVTFVGSIMTINATNEGGRAVGAALLAAGVSSSLRQIEKG